MPNQCVISISCVSLSLSVANFLSYSRIDTNVELKYIVPIKMLMIKIAK